MDPSDRTRVVDARLNADLGPLRGHWRDATRAAALERQQCLDRHALLVVAAWLDEHGATRLRSWLRLSDTDGAEPGPIAVTVGAHPHSDVGPVMGASLRHALILADPAFRGSVLDVIDLCTPAGLTADGTSGVQRLLATGAQRFRAGTADVAAMLLEPGHTVDDGLALAEERGAIARGRPPVVELAADRAWRERARQCGLSYVVAAPGRHARQPLARLPTLEGVTRIVGEPIGDQRVRVRPSREELANGFLLGRSDRCAVQLQDGDVSRVHAFVIGRGDGLLIVDAGSTNGTFVVDPDDRDVERELGRGHRAVVTPSRATFRCAGTDVEIVAP